MMTYDRASSIALHVRDLLLMLERRRGQILTHGRCAKSINYRCNVYIV